MNCASASFAALYRAHFDFTWRNLRRLGVAHGDVDDAAQEVFVVLLRKRASLPPELPIRTWLFGVIRRIAWRYRRGRARRDRLCDAVERAPSVPTCGADPTARDDPDEAYDRREAARLLDRFLDGLPPAQREVFVLAELEQLSGKEIAAVLALNQNTVWSRLRSARQAFDRSFAAIRAEHRRLADRDPAALRERAVLSLSRRAHRPTAEDRRRVGALLGIPVLGPGAGVPEVLGQPSPVAALPGARGLASLVATSPVRAGLLSVALAGATVGLLGLDSQARAPASATAGPTPASEAPAARADDPLDSIEEPAVAVDDAPIAPLRSDARSTSAGPLVDPPAPPRRAQPSRRAARRPPTATVDVQSAAVDREPADDAPASTQSLAAELELVAASRRALAEGRPARALARAEDHSRRFPAGALAHEREGLRIAALCELGRAPEATRRAAKLQRQLSDPEAVRRFTAACDD